MSVECSECERDLRGGHDPGCSRFKIICICDDEDDDSCCPIHGCILDVVNHNTMDCKRCGSKPGEKHYEFQTGDLW